MGFPHPQFIVKREGWCQHMVYAAFPALDDPGMPLREAWLVSGPFLTRGIALRVADDVKRTYIAAHQNGVEDGKRFEQEYPTLKVGRP